MLQDMWVESPWVWWGALFLGTRCIMVVNVHLQLRGGTAAQEATVVFQLHVLGEPVIHVKYIIPKRTKIELPQISLFD